MIENQVKSFTTINNITKGHNHSLIQKKTAFATKSYCCNCILMKCFLFKIKKENIKYRKQNEGKIDISI